MKITSLKSGIFGMLIVGVMLSASVIAVNASEMKDVKKSVAVEKKALPDNIKDLTALEDKLSKENREVSEKLFKVLNEIRMEQGRIKKTDSEIKKIYQQINKLRLQAEELTLKKSPEVKRLAGEREDLMKQYNDLRQEMLDVKAKKAELRKKDK